MKFFCGVAAALVVGFGLGAPAVAQERPRDDQVVSVVAKLVAERQPSREDKRFDEIGWAKDLRSAIELGKKHNRPIFLFTMDGRINTGRC